MTAAMIDSSHAAPGALVALLLCVGACQTTHPSRERVRASSDAASRSSVSSSSSPERADGGAGSASSSSSSAPAFPLGDGEADTFRGSIGGTLPVVVRLRRRGAELEGSYFYEKNGVDLALRGRADGPARWLLEERANGIVTGSFSAHLEPGGVLAGEWTPAKGGASRPFMLTRVTRYATPPKPLAIFAKHVRARKKAKAPGIGGTQNDCTVDATFAEVVGAPSQAVDDVINAALRPNDLALAECDMGSTFETHYRVVFNDKGLLSVINDEAFCCGAHPSYGRAFVNVTTNDGARLTLGKLLVPAAKPRLAALLRAPVKLRESQTGADAEAVASSTVEHVDELTGPDAEFSIEPGGLSLSLFNVAPHAVQTLFDEGFLLRWSQLQSLLVRPGPLDALVPP
jgi:hypothetical protein